MRTFTGLRSKNRPLHGNHGLWLWRGSFFPPVQIMLNSNESSCPRTSNCVAPSVLNSRTEGTGRHGVDVRSVAVHTWQCSTGAQLRVKVDNGLIFAPRVSAWGTLPISAWGKLFLPRWPRCPAASATARTWSRFRTDQERPLDPLDSALNSTKWGRAESGGDMGEL